ncbi:MAG: hypothetical protein GYA14_04605 [Ignavibacteria bacterium]|nr:hypothetical protein [Ignavibacteria bacterium]
MKTITKIIFVLLINVCLTAQVKDFPKLSGNDLAGLTIVREQTFDGSSLWGYINGGADIFLEYGFDKLMLQEVETGGLKIKIEIYKMSSPESAFGIYSVSHFKCDELSTLIKYNCLSQYQIQCSAGPYYISIINTNGSLKERELSKSIFEKVVSKINGDEITLPQIFSNDIFNDSRKEIKYFKGMLGVQNRLMEWYDYFDGIEGFEIYVLPAKVNDNTVYVGQIKFHIDSDVSIFLNRVGMKVNPSEKYSTKESGNIFRVIKMLSNNELIFIEGDNGSGKLLDSFKQIW